MKMKRRFPKRKPGIFPLKAGEGHAVVTMYRIKDKGYDVFKLPFTDNGQRKFHRFPAYPAARNKANEMLSQFLRGDADAITLKASDKVDYCRAVEALRPLGIKLDAATLELVAVRKVLEGVPVSAVEVARDYVKRHPATMPDKTVEEVVDELIKAKEDAKLSERYIEDLNYRLGKFKDAFQTSINRVDGIQLRGFMENLGLSPRSFNNFRAALTSLFEFAKRRKYLPADWNDFQSVETVKDAGGAIEIFTVQQMADLLTHASEQLLPFLAIGAFAGLRSAEIDRLDWKEVRLGTGYIVVEKGKAKTAGRRIVPLHENLKVWLASYAKKSGKVWPHSKAYLYEALEGAARDAKVEWKPNALRHSFISYRVAETQDVNKVALEAGNSPAMIFSNYRELVTPEEAKSWFSLKPGGAGADKVIYLKVA